VDLVTGADVAASDGSFYPDNRRAIAAWIISSADGQEFIKGGGLIRGPRLCHSAYRSEVAGLLGLSVGIFTLHRLALLHELYPPSASLGCHLQNPLLWSHAMALNYIETFHTA